MKMNKIVLASLLSVSLLGASTSVFAEAAPTVLDTTADTGNKNADTETNFEVTGGSLALSTNTEGTTSNLDFGKVTVATLLKGNGIVDGKTTLHPASDFSAKVTDTLGAKDYGWKLEAAYTPLTGKNGDGLDESLQIGNATALSNDNKGEVVYAAAADDVANALKTTEGVMNIKTAANNITLSMPTQGALVQKYTGKLAWTLSATPGNDVAATVNKVSVQPAN